MQRWYSRGIEIMIFSHNLANLSERPVLGLIQVQDVVSISIPVQHPSSLRSRSISNASHSSRRSKRHDMLPGNRSQTLIRVGCLLVRKARGVMARHHGSMDGYPKRHIWSTKRVHVFIALFPRPRIGRHVPRAMKLKYMPRKAEKYFRWN